MIKKSILIAVWLAAAASFGVKHCDNPTKEIAPKQPPLEEQVKKVPEVKKKAPKQKKKRKTQGLGAQVLPSNYFLYKLEGLQDNYLNRGVSMMIFEHGSEKKDKYWILTYINGTLSNGIKYSLDIDRMNTSIYYPETRKTLHFNHTRSLEVWLETPQNTKINYDFGDDKKIWMIHADDKVYYQDTNTPRAKEMFAFANQNFKDILRDLNRKAPGLYDFVYNSRLTPKR